MSTEVTYAPPATSMLLSEMAAVCQLPRLAWRAPRLVRLPRGDGPVVVFPGFGTNDAASLPIRGTLRALGYSPHGWALGINKGDVAGTIEAATARVRGVVETAGQPAALLGWSLGGVFAREIARDEPNLVTRVITYGTPVVGGPRYTRSAASYSSEQLDEIEATVNARNLIPIDRPITAFYSRRDGVVDWRTCLDDFSPDVENIEVRSTHIGMTIDPDVWATIAQRLAQ